MVIYRSYDIEGDAAKGFTWTDERGFIHYYEGVTKTPYATEDQAMDAIDAYRRNLRRA